MCFFCLCELSCTVGIRAWGTATTQLNIVMVILLYYFFIFIYRVISCKWKYVGTIFLGWIYLINLLDLISAKIERAIFLKLNFVWKFGHNCRFRREANRGKFTNGIAFLKITLWFKAYADWNFSTKPFFWSYLYIRKYLHKSDWRGHITYSQHTIITINS